MINIDKGVSIILNDWLNVRKDVLIHFITDETHLRELGLFPAGPMVLMPS